MIMPTTNFLLGKVSLAYMVNKPLFLPSEVPYNYSRQFLKIFVEPTFGELTFGELTYDEPKFGELTGHPSKGGGVSSVFWNTAAV
jgi:hypothetical protein